MEVVVIRSYNVDLPQITALLKQMLGFFRVFELELALIFRFVRCIHVSDGRGRIFHRLDLLRLSDHIIFHLLEDLGHLVGLEKLIARNLIELGLIQLLVELVR